MKSAGVGKKIDDLGRIVIPYELRAKLGIKKQDLLEIFVEGDRIVLTKPSDHCIFCHSTSGLSKTKIKMKSVCSTCLDEMNHM